jgi:large subunit ribosomal protein L10
MATQNAQMTHKIAVVDEVKTRMGAATASIVSEYRGLTVAELAALRTALAAVGGDYKIFKNTLVRRAIDGGEYQPLTEYLSGPSALTFVDGDVSAVAKALRDFARGNPHLVIKGGLADGSLLSISDLAALAELPPRDVLLARMAGALAAPLQKMAGLLQALPRNLAYGLSALIEQREAGGEKLPEAATEAPDETAPPADVTPAEPAAEAAMPEVEADAPEVEADAPEVEADAPDDAAADATAAVESEPEPETAAAPPAEAEPEQEEAAAPVESEPEPETAAAPVESEPEPETAAAAPAEAEPEQEEAAVAPAEDEAVAKPEADAAPEAAEADAAPEAAEADAAPEAGTDADTAADPGASE